MSANTKIQWCDSTVNPTMGCDGCELWSASRKSCYAGVLHARFGGVTKGYAPTFEKVTQFPNRMAAASRLSDLAGKERADKPWLGGSPRLIFVSDMSDALSKSVPFEYLQNEVIRSVVSEEGRRHNWLWLTKRPERMAEFSAWLKVREIEWPDNLWAGTSITNQRTTSRIHALKSVGRATTLRFLSVEPQIEAVELVPWLGDVDWVIQGGESGANARPFHLEWAEALLSQCRKAQVPYFLKQFGSVVHAKGKQIAFEDGHGNDWQEWPVALRVREIPTTKATTDDQRLADGEEVSSISFRRVVLALALEHGVITNEQVEAVIAQRFGHLFSPDDLRLLNGRPKWKNTLDWAKATLAGQGLVATLPTKVGKKKQKLIVLIRHPNVPNDVLRLALSKKPTKNFRKQCRECGSYSPMANEYCRRCEAKFPVPSRRIVVEEASLSARKPPR